MQNLHLIPPFASTRREDTFVQRLPCVLICLGRTATIEGACRRPGQSVLRAHGTKLSRPLFLPARLPRSIRAGTVIFILQGAHIVGIKICSVILSS